MADFRSALLLLGFAVLAVVAACDGDESGSPEATPTATAATTPTASPAAATPTTGAESQIVVLAALERSITDEGYYAYDEAEISVRNTRSADPVASFTIEGPLHLPRYVYFHAGELLAHHPHSLAAYDLDGNFLRTVLELPPDRHLLGSAISNDGTKLAYIHTAAGELTVETIADTHLVVIDLASGNALLEVAQTDPPLAGAGFWGQLFDVWWGPDDGHVVVNGITHGDSPAPFAAVTLSGQVVVPTATEPGQIGTEVEPQGRAAVVGFQYLGSGCVGPVDKEGDPVIFRLRWVDLPGGATARETIVDQQPYAALWSPAGDTILFQQLDCDDRENPERAWYTWSPSMPQPERVADPIQLWRDWYGDRALLSRDPDGMLHLPLAAASGFYLPYRTSGDAFVIGDTELAIQGEPGTLRFLGFVE